MSDKNNLAEEAYTYIKEKLYNFDILPEQTVSDFLLSKQLNMSRTPIRQALQMLKNDLSAAAGKYLTVEADEISVTITQTTPVILTAKIPLKRNEEYHVKTI